jgi:hypothetical protein
MGRCMGNNCPLGAEAGPLYESPWNKPKEESGLVQLDGLA